MELGTGEEGDVPECLTELLVLGEGFSLHLVSEYTGVEEYPDRGLFGEFEEGGGKHCLVVRGGGGGGGLLKMQQVICTYIYSILLR